MTEGYKYECILSLTLSILAMTAMTDASFLSIAVQPGPVEVKQGNDVSLWCQVKQDTRRRATRRMVPVHWQSPPNFRTRTSNCVSFVGQKYDISCGESPYMNMCYNMTIKNVQWADKGKYRCIYIRHRGTVDLQVLVPVRGVSLTYVSSSTSEPLVLSKGIDAVVNCTTDCAYPAPTISWFENDQPFKDSARVTTTDSGCSGEKQGQKRTISTITVRGEYVDKEREESSISCKAGNVFGEKRISKAIVVTYDDILEPCEKIWCQPGRVCQAASKNQGVCVCGPPDLCNGHRKQVCGDDGILYPSHCELHRMACIKDKHVGVDHTNMCKSEVTISPPQPVISVDGTKAIAGNALVVVLTLIFIIYKIYRKRDFRDIRQDGGY